MLTPRRDTAPPECGEVGFCAGLLSNAKTGPVIWSLFYEVISFGGDGRIRTAEWRFCKPLP